MVTHKIDTRAVYAKINYPNSQHPTRFMTQPTLELNASKQPQSHLIQIGDKTYNLEHHTPMMVQYLTLKADYPDALLLYRMGDFYELFFDDAILASEILDITLTRRGQDKAGNVIAMAGVPYHSADSYMARLIANGQTVVICEQVDTPAEADNADKTDSTKQKPANKLMRREVVKTLTAGTLTDDTLISPNTTPSVVAIDLGIKKGRGKPDTLTGIGISQLDLNAGTLRTQTLAFTAKTNTETDNEARSELSSGLKANAFAHLFGYSKQSSDINPNDDPSAPFASLANQVSAILTRFAPSEIILSEGLDEAWRLPLKQWLETTLACHVLAVASSDFHPNHASQTIAKQFGISHLDGLGIEGDSLAQTTCASLIHYAQQTQQQHIPHINEVIVERDADYLIVDATSSRGLELFESNTPNGTSLMSVVNHCKTPMGKRLLVSQLKRPLRLSSDGNLHTLNLRLDAIGWLTRLPASAIESLQAGLTGVADIERIATRISLGTAKPKDLRRLSDTVHTASQLTMSLTHLGLSDADTGLLPLLLGNLPPHTAEINAFSELIEQAIVEDPPAHTREGGMIATGFDAEFDRLTHLHTNVQDTLDAMVQEAQDTHNLPSLKIGFNKVSGFYFELPKGQAKSAPDAFIRRQTLKNSERFTTEALKELETEYLDAQTDALAREKAVYAKLLQTLGEQLALMRTLSATLAQLDVLINWAWLAITFGWTRPTLDASASFVDIRAGRHVVVEAMGHPNFMASKQTKSSPSPSPSTTAQTFVANDCQLGAITDSDNRHERMLLITGPNMGGKSTYMRQTALIVLLACCGSFVPASSATIGDIDRIFTRIGSADDLAGGKSTFMVEMMETAQILNLATNQSLVLMDEVGRGTATTDGLAIATACVKKLCAMDCLTLFATHYFELTELTNQSDYQHHLKNVHVATTEVDGQLLLLHKIMAGSASSSFGLHVAKLAGLPNDVLNHAKNELNHLQASAKQKKDTSSEVTNATTQRDAHGYSNHTLPYAQLDTSSRLPATPEQSQPHAVLTILQDIDPDDLTPKQALETMYQLKSAVQLN